MSEPAPIAWLRQRLADRTMSGILSVPGCWDALTLLLVEEAGFEAAFVSGAAVSMAALGLPDLGYITGERIAATVCAMRGASDLPLIVDGDTGFGSALTLQAFVRAVERAGASAVQIEDQTFPKRCGHMAGKQVVPRREAVDRVRAALDARSSMLVIARTDALGCESLDEALERAEAFIEAGADAVFIEGPRTTQELAEVASRLAHRVPLVHNLVEGGVSPTRSGHELGALGFAIALHPLLLMHGLVAAGPRWLSVLRETGSTETIAHEIGDLPRMNRLTGASRLLSLGDRYDC